MTFLRLIFFVVLACGNLFAAPVDDVEDLIVDPDLVDYLYSRASYKTQLPDLDASQRPLLYTASEENLKKIVCPQDPQNCRQLAAVYNDEMNFIIVRNDLNMENDTDHSFLLHEIVHALQNFSGELKYETHSDLCKTEAQAYRVQNLYLKDRGLFVRFGEVLRSQGCPIQTLVDAGLFI